MGVEIFQDPVGQNIKARLMNYALENYKGKPKQLEESVDRTHRIIEIAREAIKDSLDAEISVLSFRHAEGDEVPLLFISGLMHAMDVINGKTSIIGKLDIDGEA